MEECTQQEKVSEFIQRMMRFYVSRTGLPATGDKTLLLFCYKGLKPHMREQCKLDPRTCAFWISFETLAQHATTIDNQAKDTIWHTRSHPDACYAGLRLWTWLRTWRVAAGAQWAAEEATAAVVAQTAVNNTVHRVASPNRPGIWNHRGIIEEYGIID